MFWLDFIIIGIIIILAPFLVSFCSSILSTIGVLFIVIGIIGILFTYYTSKTNLSFTSWLAERITNNEFTSPDKYIKDANNYIKSNIVEPINNIKTKYIDIKVKDNQDVDKKDNQDNQEKYYISYLNNLFNPPTSGNYYTIIENVDI